MRRVVVLKSIGVASPLENSINGLWDNLKKGISGTLRIKDKTINQYLKAGDWGQFEVSDFKTQIAAETNIEDFEKRAQENMNTEIIPNITGKEFLKRMDRFCQLGVIAADQLDKDIIRKAVVKNPYRVGVITGSGVGGLSTMNHQMRILFGDPEKHGGPRFVDPLLIAKNIIDELGHWDAVMYGAKGANFSVVSACASSAHAISVAYDKIAIGKLMLCITGGSEAPINPMGIAGFNSAHALSLKNEEPEKASKPFDKNRDGFVMGEGAAAIILMDLEAALELNAPISAEIVGIGETGDAYHLIAPDPDGISLAKAMEMAMEMAGISPKEIACINPHGTGTGVGDPPEAKAIKIAFGKYAESVHIAPTKWATGHSLGAIGSIEAGICAKILETNIIPPHPNLFEVDPSCEGLLYAEKKAKEANREIEYIMSNSAGFGGHNISIILKKWTNS